MKMNKLAKNVTVAAGLMMVLAVPGWAREDQAQSRPAPSPMASSPAPQKVRSLEDYFVGLDLTNEQKASIDKVRQETDAKKAIVAKDAKLDPYQKDAMILGYTRLEYGEIFQLLTPVQQKVVRQRMAAAKAANKSSGKPTAPTRPSN